MDEIFAGRRGLFAGKPAPTMMVVLRGFVANAKPCGSGLAHEEGGAGYAHFRLAIKTPEAFAVRGFFIARTISG